VSSSPAELDRQFREASDRASNLLEGGQPLQSLEWFARAEELAVASGNEAELAGLLGDEAVAFRRVGNMRRAFETYERAIDYSRRLQDYLNLSRWTGNLGALKLQAGDLAGAEACFREELQAAARTGRPDQASVAAGNIASLLCEQQRFGEAIEEMDRAIETSGGDSLLTQIWRANEASVYARWADQLAQEGDAAEALRAYDGALHHLDLANAEEKRYAAQLHAKVASIHERLNNVPETLAALDRAIQLLSELGEADSARELTSVRDAIASGRLSIE
jgi:tetratricopeptide (TPR) repeat protein